MKITCAVVPAAAVAAVVLGSWDVSAQTASVFVNQKLDNKHLEINGADYDNSVSVDIDLADIQGSPGGINAEEGDDNLQDNSADVDFTADSAETTVNQELLDSSFNRDSADFTPSDVHNSAFVNVNVPNEFVGTFGLNAAAGA